MLGVGLGLRVPHYRHVLEHRPRVAWFEVVTENFLGNRGGSGGRPLSILEKIRSHYPVVFHGVSLSVGSKDPLDKIYLKRLKALSRKIEPALISDHLCWTGIDGKNLHDLLPLPYTEEAVRHVARRVIEVQETLGRKILLENVSSYLTFRHSEMQEWEFLTEVCNRADCNILLDINNIYVSSRNHGFDPEVYLKGVPAHRVRQFHLAGHADNGTHVIDTHDAPIREEVWNLYRKALALFGPVPTLIERDDKIPEFHELEAEMKTAMRFQKELDEKPFTRRSAKVDELGHRAPA
jgi:uncharacterized protein